MNKFRLLLILMISLLTTPVHAAPRTQANIATPCGVVDAIDYPVDTLYTGTIARGWDDFRRFRQRFGGIHVGLDVAFHRLGDPVYAAARGRVTYSDIEGWDINKGVVVVEHVFPDGTIYYSLYGHVEETETVSLPPVGTCVERGQIVGTVGWPETGAPHLHYEIRRILPGDGGPGYIDGNPLEAGWLHPLDFTFLWQARLQPGFVSAQTFTEAPSLPPLSLPDGTNVLAAGESLQARDASGTLRWQVTTDGAITGMAALDGGRVVAQTETGQVSVLANGRYDALWRVDTLDVRLPFVIVRRGVAQRVVFAASNGALYAFDATGDTLWRLESADSNVQPTQLIPAANAATIAYIVRDNGRSLLRIVDADGAIIHTTESAGEMVITPLADGWRVLAGGALQQIDATGDVTPLAQNVTPAPGRGATMAVDRTGVTYLYMDDAARTLLAVDAAGAVRWRQRFAAGGDAPPLLATDAGCLLYALDSAGTLSVMNAATGETVARRNLYAGGARTRQLSGRLLRVDSRNQVTVSAGFLSLVTFDGAILGADVLDTCLLG